MNTRIIALTCALTAAACAEQKPAQDPGASSNSPAPGDHSSTTTTSATEPATPMPNPAVRTTTTTTGQETPAAPPTAAQGGPAPAVANNPGAADQTKGAENTKVNERDRHGSTLTPMDQGNSESETKISAAIRKAIMGDKSLSFTAKNVKIITVGTKVTLRGPVKSDQEKSVIETLAKQAPGVSAVDNQLEVTK